MFGAQTISIPEAKQTIWIVRFYSWEETFIDSVWSSEELAEDRIEELGGSARYVCDPFGVDELGEEPIE